MKATEFIALALKNSRHWTMGLINNMQDSPLTQPTPNGGNHPLWVLGHLTHSESHLLDVFLLGSENRFPELEEKFGMKTEPTANAADYPPMEELLAKNEQIRSALLEHLATLTDDDLDKPANVPEEQREFFGTVGAVFSATVTHYGFHTGQVADARRAAGRQPLMA